MNRYTRAAAAALLMVSGFGSIGCVHTGKGGGERYRNVVDTSWPDRYNHAAQQAVLAPFAQQVTNGNFQERTLWNWYFEPGSERLHPAGMAKLNAMSHNYTDTKIYLQHAADLPLTPDNADKVVELRHELTAKRAAVVREYMATKPGTPEYDIAVHNGPTPRFYAPFAVSALRAQTIGYVGSLTGGQQQTQISGNSGASVSGGAPGGGAGAAGGAGGGTAPVPSGTPGGAMGGTPTP
ncbi:MAG: hypothetical protein C0467_13210 [Planctomycetaceae bacterium]|nr:hypothetical protein [Planctomycetaceae bacterium]